LSAGRSYLFNRVLAERVAAATWDRALPGDLLAFTDSRSFFIAGENECADPRLAILDLHPTGPLWGAGPSPAGEATQVLEGEVAAAEPAIAKWLAEAGMNGVFFASPLVACRGIIRGLTFCNLNSSCRPDALPQPWYANWSAWQGRRISDAYSDRQRRRGVCPRARRAL
jgi:hypothetical protein